MSKLTEFVTEETGAAAAEYALILALIAVFIIGALTFLGKGIGNTFNTIGNNLNATGS